MRDDYLIIFFLFCSIEKITWMKLYNLPNFVLFTIRSKEIIDPNSEKFTHPHFIYFFLINCEIVNTLVTKKCMDPNKFL